MTRRWFDRRVSPRTVRALIAAWASAVAVLGAVLLALAAQAAWRAAGSGRSGDRVRVQLVPPTTRFARPAATEQAVVRPRLRPAAARPFSFASAAPDDRSRALRCLSSAIYYEAQSESSDGQRAVAQVVLNRVRHPAFPHTVCGVVYQGREAARCQFSFACDGAETRHPAPAGWVRAGRVAAAALAGRVFAPVGLSTHYHSRKVRPDWSRTLVLTDAIGAHLFHRWRGPPGRLAAFTARYRGGEPDDGTREARAAQPPPALPLQPVAAISAAPDGRAFPGTPAHSAHRSGG